MKPLMSIDEPPRAPTAPRGFALWQLGFRPFYLLASSFAALSIVIWALQYGGWIDRAVLAGPVWHAHEMIFGYTLAVIVGFLFTAGRNWSGQPTPTGAALAVLALLWVAGRVLVLTPWSWPAAFVNVAFPLAAAIGLARALVAARNRRNYFFIAVLVGLALAVLVVHLAQLRVIDLPGWLGIRVALDVVLFVMAVMAGRVVPMFTNNGVPGARAVRHAGVERAALGSVLVLLAVDVLQLHGAVSALVLGVAALVHLARLWLWQPWTTLRTPLVWVLHAAYLWIPIHLALRAAAELSWLAAPVATHALTVGAIGGLTIGMMTRTARGHTARPLRADGYEVACYLAICAAAIVRVFVPLVAPEWQVASVLVSAVLWSGGFALYVVRYWPVLTRPRLDGQPG